MHKEYKRIVENSDKAVLFIHGIVGTPDHFADFLSLVDECVSVYNVLLDGHGKGVKEFSRTSMEKWEGQITATVAELAKNHKEVYIVAHSLGCLLAVEQAVRNPQITKLFLLAIPLKLFLKPKMFSNSLKVYFNRLDPDDDDALQAAKRCCGVKHSKNLLAYLGWIPRFLELFSKIRDVRKQIADIQVPCWVYQSAKDEMVSKSTNKLLEENKNIVVTELKNSGHYYYEKRDYAFLKEAFANFVS